LCDDAIVAISYRTSSSGTTTFQTATLSYTLNGGASTNISTGLRSNLGTTYAGLATTITCNYGDTIVFTMVSNGGVNGSNWGQGLNSSYSNIGHWECGTPSWTYIVNSTGNINIYFNLTSANTVWATVIPC
jgi:hypothetical protein